MTRPHTSHRTAAIAALAVATVIGLAVPSAARADDPTGPDATPATTVAAAPPADDDAGAAPATPGTGETGGHVVAVGAPPVPPSTTGDVGGHVVAVGRPPAPPTNPVATPNVAASPPAPAAEVAAAPPTTVATTGEVDGHVVAVGSPPVPPTVPPTTIVASRSASPAPAEVRSTVDHRTVRATADVLADVIQAWW